MSAEVVRTERRGAVLWATVDRPERANACGSEVMVGLERWLEAAADPEIRVLVLTGTGTAFCAGADLREAGALVGDPDALVDFLRRGRDLVEAVRTAPVPVVAAVNGAAYAGGLELLLACDLAVAGSSALLGDRHVTQGQVPGWGSSAMLPVAVGRTLATRLMLLGDTLTAHQALAAGLVGEVVADEDLERAATSVAETLAAHDPAAVAALLGLTRRRGDDEVVAAALEWQVLLDHVAADRTREHAAQF